MSAAMRRQPVAQGGMFSTHKASFSKETQDLLKVMMQESKLTSFQQRQLREKMKTEVPQGSLHVSLLQHQSLTGYGGQSLPVRCHPTSSKPGSHQPTKKTTPHKPRSHGQGLRSKVTIERTPDREPDYRPAPSRYNSSIEKAKLQNVMAFGSELEPAQSLSGREEEEEEKEIDRFDEVVEEIEERRQFLAEMEGLGRGKEFRSKITTEVSQRVRELEVLDQQRCSELTRTLTHEHRLPSPQTQ